MLFLVAGCIHAFEQPDELKIITNAIFTSFSRNYFHSFDALCSDSDDLDALLMLTSLANEYLSKRLNVGFNLPISKI